MPPPTFGPIPDHLWMRGPQFPKKEGTARFNLEQLARQKLSVDLRPGFQYGNGTWGYTVLRTVYTPESDVLFPEVIDKIKRAVHYGSHSHRFPLLRQHCEEKCIPYAEPNDEICRRFYMDVIEDKANLEKLDGPEHFMALYAYFRQWLVGVGVNPEDPDPELPIVPRHPRFRQFLVIDAESLQALAKIPNETPPLRCAVDLQEKYKFVRWGQEGWLWLLDTTIMPKPEFHESGIADGVGFTVIGFRTGGLTTSSGRIMTALITSSVTRDPRTRGCIITVRTRGCIITWVRAVLVEISFHCQHTRVIRGR
ncbi:hypothetical protein GE09DRAFT_1074299 [Coniochaeta sp. 2T2.1]|nr:hypothetical protein GE09DRAFT_1074299 [Coniochaeta sp. 2T2.1]